MKKVVKKTVKKKTSNKVYNKSGKKLVKKEELKSDWGNSKTIGAIPDNVSDEIVWTSEMRNAAYDLGFHNGRQKGKNEGALSIMAWMALIAILGLAVYLS